MKGKWLGIFLILPALIACYPIVFLAVGSLMSPQELTEHLRAAMEGGEGYVSFGLLPRFPTLRAYVELLLDSPGFFVMFWNSVKMTVGILAGQMLTGIPAAWGFARYSFPFRKTLFTIYIILMMMPFQVQMLSNYLVLDKLGLLNQSLGIILPAAFSTLPVFLMYRFFRQIPEAIIESARLDGAGEFRIFLKIGLPMGSAGIVSAGVLSFLECWNLIEQPLAFLKDKSLWPLSLFLPEIGLEEAAMAFAASMMALIPAFFVFLAGRDYLEQGIAAVAVKE